VTLYDLLVQHLLVTNNDQRDYDLASAEAAAQAIEDEGRLLSYLARVEVKG
jgi:hypothetical protein